MNILGGRFKWGPGGYNNGHIGHQGNSWKTENAWDLMTGSDVDVYSITEGTVMKIKNTKPNGGHLFGTSIEILGRGDYPTIFYSNLSGVKLTLGKKVRIGDKIGKVGSTSQKGESFLHVALPFGKKISDLVNENGEILGSESMPVPTEKPTTDYPRQKSVEKEKDSDTNFYTKLSKIITPIALGGALLEEVERIKNLLK